MSSRRSRSGRQAQPDDVEAVEQVLAERALAHALFQVLVRGGNDAHVALQRLVAADAVELPVGQHAQQPRLQVEGHVADLVQEQRAAVGLFEAPAACGLRAGEGTALVAEELASSRSLGMAAVLMATKRPVGTRAVFVQRARHQFLAGAAFAGDEHGDVALAQPADGAEHVLHGRRLAQHLGRLHGRASATSSRRLSSTARRISSTAVFTSKGLGRYSKAPPWKAETALSRSEKAVMMITGSPGWRCLTWASRSMPLPPGMRMSLTSTWGASSSSACRTSRGLEKVRTANCSRVSAFSSTNRMDWSSSTTQMGFMRMCRALAGARSGQWNQDLEDRAPGTLSHSIVPLCCCTKVCASVRPSPEPPSRPLTRG
jgi:hypothetical protein